MAPDANILEIATRIFNSDIIDNTDRIELENPENLAELIKNDPFQAITDLLDFIENN